MRSLPEPLCTYKLFDEFLAAEVEHNLDKNYLNSVLQKLPKINLYTLQYLIFCLYQISNFSELNKMTSMNLSIIFAQNLIAPKNSSPFDTSNYDSIYKVFACLIENYSFFFKSVEEERENQQK